jgi:hypothetical protein
MAGVFKSLDQSDVRITPFRTYKLWAETIPSGSNTGSIYSIYKADYSPIPNYLLNDVLNDNFDQGNSYFETSEYKTVNNKFQRVVHRSIDHLYYRDFYTNNKASFGSGNINKQVRFLEDQAYIISMPQSKFGEAILPGSVKLQFSSSIAKDDDNSLNRERGWTVLDDSFGNLYISSSDANPYKTNWEETVGDVSTNYSSSVTKTLVGEWPLDELYKYVDVGPINITGSFNRGLWLMDALYKNVSVSFPYRASSSFALPSDLIGASMTFTSSLSSSIEIKPSVVPDYSQKYNFENGDFSISMMIKPTQFSTHVSGSILIEKQGPVEELKIDENGNIHSQLVPNKSPYRLILTSAGELRFERDGGSNSIFSLQAHSALSLNKLHHVAITKLGSTITLNYWNVEDPLNESGGVSGTCLIEGKECSNLSNIFVGNSYTQDRGFDGIIDNIKIYKEALTNYELYILYRTLGVGNLNIGNVFYNHGMMTLTSIPSRFGYINSIQTRGTHTIWENEISCTIGPNDFGMSSNPSLQEYSSVQNNFVYKAFVTSSFFKPYITTIGLYDDYGRMLVVGKLSTPIQTPNNTDTTFIVRYDK